MKHEDFYTPEQRAEHERGFKRATEAHRRFAASITAVKPKPDR